MKDVDGDTRVVRKCDLKTIYEIFSCFLRISQGISMTNRFPLEMHRRKLIIYIF